ncbi:MAG: hypothetical protein APR63_10230 [Desulfuromonas sp. SDB]|nr:MAG: hypothetical protein APR63_10230 [Desulfuromonas sp. SDB]
MIKYNYICTALGWILISAEHQQVKSISFWDSIPACEKFNDSFLDFCTGQIQDYLAGKLNKFNLGYNLGGTEFDQQVYRKVNLIPFGKVKSYEDIAVELGDKNLSRAVGNANRRNPLPLIIPCHRIIKKNGDPGGYSGGGWRKRWLLQHESKFFNN